MKQSQPDVASFLAFNEALSKSAQSSSDVLGLVLVGSTAETFRADEWSDHDFFLVVKVGLGPNFRRDLSWLPNYGEIAYSTPETVHGLKVVYKDGRLLEFAVFEDEELELASVNSWAVPVDKERIAERVTAIQLRTKPKPFVLEDEWGLFLATVLIAVGRARRGELLIAGQGIRTRALDYALGMLKVARTPIANSLPLEDNLDRFRRVESQYPTEAKLLNEISELPVEAAALALLNFVVDLGVINEEEKIWADVVRARFGWV